MSAAGSAPGAAGAAGATGATGARGATGTKTASGRRLADLRVPELRQELERRGLDRAGVKAVLFDRLAQAITDDGQNPDEIFFETPASEKKTPVKKTSRSGSMQEGDFDETMDDVNIDNLVVKDEVTEEDVALELMDNELSNDVQVKTEDTDLNRMSKSEDSQANTKNDKELDSGSKKMKREASDVLESSEPKKICKEGKDLASENAKKNVDVNGLDAEDSINLDIGEDEFLNEEGEAGCNAKKDESMEAQGAVETSQPNSGEEKPPAVVKQEAGADGSAQDEKQQEISTSEVPSTEDSKNNSNVSDPDKEKDEKDIKKTISQSASASSRNLWVSGLSSSTRAKDLKQLCSRHGKVIGAKVVINARTPGSRCYGYVTMASAEDAQNCIKHLHRTELHGRMISMEKAKSDSTAANHSGAGVVSSRASHSGSQSQRSPRRQTNREKTDDKSSPERKKDASKDIKKEEKPDEDVPNKISKEGDDLIKEEKVEGEKADNVSTIETDSKKGRSKSKATSQERRLKQERARDRVRQERGRHRRPPTRDFLSFSKIRKEREAQRAREHVRRARSEERRRRAAEQSLRELERRHRAEKHRQRVEKDRIALEREKLRIEREKIEREKQELHRLERERQKLERERLDLERLELKRAQIRLEEERGRAAAKRNYMYGSGGGSSGIMSRSKQPLPPPPPTYDRPGGRGGDNSGNANTARFNMPLLPHITVPAPPYEISTGSSGNNPSGDRGPPSRDRPRDRERQRDFKRDYPPPPRHTSSSHAGGSANDMKYPSNGASYEPRQPLPPGTRPRDQRYGSMEGGGDTRGNSGNNIRERPTSSGHERSGGNSGTSYRPNDSSRRSPKPASRDHRYSDTSVSMKGDSWANSGNGGDGGSRYGGTITSGGGQYGDTRYSYQPAPPGSNSFQDMVSYPAPRDLRSKY